MKSILKIIGVIFILITIFFNFTFIPVLLGIEPIINVYHYENEVGESRVEIPSKGRTIDLSEPGLKRKFRKNYLKFWKWTEYIVHPRWRVQYYK